MTALITGASGFIGRHLSRALLDAGHEVIGLDMDPDSTFTAAEAHYRSIACDCTDTPAVLISLATIPVSRVDIIFHLAGVKRSADAGAYHRVNTEGTRAMLNVARELATRRFLLASSLAAVGPGDGERLLTEDDAPQPRNEYGRSKLAAERLVEEAPLEGTIVRAPVVYGPGIVDSFVFLIRLVERHLALLIGAGRANFAFVTDLVDGIARAGLSPQAANRTYFLAHPRHYGYREIYTEIASALETWTVPVRIPMFLVSFAARMADLVAVMTRRPISFGSRNLEDIRHGAWAIDVSRAHREFGFRAETDLAAGIDQLYQWYRRRNVPAADGAA